MSPSNSHQVYAPAGWPGLSLPTGVSVEDLPITSPYCIDSRCRAFREGFAEDERRTPLKGLLRYGYWTVWFYAIWLLLFTTIYLCHRIHDRLVGPRKATRKLGLKDRAFALIRFWTYRRPNNRVTRKIGLRQISYGTLALLAFTTVFLAILPWPQSRFLRARFRFGSPPLSIRCAMLISALTPLTVALAGKVNIITWMTGMSYEKLNVFHRYGGYAIFVLGTIHTIPHLYAPVKDGGWSMLGKLYENQTRELSGTPLFFAMFGLTFLSIPWIRRRFYETFKYLHIFLALVYIGCFFWHAYGNLCPNYIYATVAVLAFSNIIRFAQRHHNLQSFSNLAGFPTTLTQLHGNVTRIAIEIPKSLKWKPGQHAFLRVPSLSLLHNHPFSITNVPSLEQHGNVHEMVFLVRGQQGFTKKLFRRDEIVENTARPQPAPTQATIEQLVDYNLLEDFTFGLEKPKTTGAVKKGVEHIEDVDNIVAADAITVIEEEVTNPMSPFASTSQLPTSITRGLRQQPSVSSLPPRDEITEETLRVIAQKPAGVRSSTLTSSYRASASTMHRSSIPAVSSVHGIAEQNLSAIQTRSDTHSASRTIAENSYDKYRQSSVTSMPPMDEITRQELLAIQNRSGTRSVLRTIIDGPYGSHRRPFHKIYDTVLLIAGGSGITACLPQILGLTQRLSNQKKNEILATRQIHLIWTVRDAECLSWIERELTTAIRNIREHPSPNNVTFTVDVYVTRSSDLAEDPNPSETKAPEDPMSPMSPVSPMGERKTFTALDVLSAPGNVPLPTQPCPALRRLNSRNGNFGSGFNFDIGSGEDSVTRDVRVAMHYCRPVIRDVVKGHVSGDRTVVLGCGPPGLSAEVANTVADLQKMVWTGEMREIKLILETFGS